MSRIKLVAIAALLALAGCATDSGIRGYWMLHTADIQQLKPGQSKADVERIIGKPFQRLVFPNLGEEVWDYRYLDVQTHMRSAVHFDTKGIVKYATQEYDSEHYSAIGM